MILQRNYLLAHIPAEGQTFTMPSMVDTEVHNPSIQEIMEKYSVGILPVNMREPIYDGDLDSEDLTPPSMLDDFSDLVADEGASNNNNIGGGSIGEEDDKKDVKDDLVDDEPTA